MDGTVRTAVEERAYAIWQEAGCPHGYALLHWIQAELELGVIPEVRADDPFVTLHELSVEARMQDDPEITDDTTPAEATSRRPPSTPTDEPLQRSVDRAVPRAERLPRGAEENPLSEHVEEVATEHAPSPGTSTFEGGDRVNQGG